MIWVWTDPPESEVAVWADYDDKHSPIHSYRFIECERLDKTNGSAVLLARRFKLATIESFKCLPTTAGAPAVDSDIAKVVVDVCGSEAVQFYPVSVIVSDGQSDKFRFTLPLICRECLDMEQSEGLEWALPDERLLLMDYERLVFVPGSLSDCDIVRDEVTKRVLVSDNLKLALESVGDSGLHFTEPEQLVSASTLIRATGTT